MAILSTLLTTLALTAGAFAHQFTACTNKNYGGRCETWESTHNSCVTYTAAATWDKKVSSVYVGPAGVNVVCYIYDGYSCDGVQGGPITPANPHPDLGAHGWNDRISSFKCGP